MLNYYDSGLSPPSLRRRPPRKVFSEAKGRFVYFGALRCQSKSHSGLSVITQMFNNCKLYIVDITVSHPHLASPSTGRTSVTMQPERKEHRCLVHGAIIIRDVEDAVPYRNSPVILSRAKNIYAEGDRWSPLRFAVRWW